MHLFKILSILLLLNCTTMVNAQEIPWRKDKPLTWKDFQGVPDANSSYAAVTNSRIKYNYRYELKDSVYKITFKLENVFYTQTSWSKKDQRNKDLLHHEQLHFDINELFTRRLSVALNSSTYTNNFREEIHFIYQRLMDEERDFQTKYDNQSIHSGDSGSQVVWEQYIHKLLMELPPNY
ncbi:MAG: hypothetical protein JWQ34_1440 [Mucilaginibacter sp.]|uniref:DUF922 domain-containing protein n=1 Tax=Mucilaginibacter sp. TaxID=1882438 RepID=UPI00260B0E4A|nr:hypothetical protein [Mucilaginibacter sp.]MDB5003215.1 hypothetical protein [Mucilaginibacter sp.]